MRIGLDLDGVLYDFCGAANFLLEEHFGLSVPKAWPYWSFPIDYCKEQGKPEAWDWLWKPEGGIAAGLFRHGHMLKGAAKFTYRLAKEHEVVVITSRPASARADTLSWLGFHNMPIGEVHILGSGVKKSDVRPRCDVYIDDGDHNIQDLIDNTATVALLVDRPWNQDYDHSAHGVWGQWNRVHSWEHIEGCIEEVGVRGWLS